MESNLPAPNNSPERGVPNLNAQPRVPEAVSSAYLEASKEKPAQQEIKSANPSQGAPVLPPPVPVVALPQQPAGPAAPVVKPAHDDNPVVARDEELIEKEWVDKAKKVVSQTKSDPYLQEKEVGKLQADYLKKRYGKEVKISD